MTDVVNPKTYALSDRYRLDGGRVFLSGVQALARLPLEQFRADRSAGWNTASFISGYPGSPLAGFDREVRAASRLAPDLPIVVQPAVNEELAAAAVMGSQLVAGTGTARYDGVIGFWYGKAPGLDRATDAIRHGVFAGAHPKGGAVLLVGDDPAAKSSTLPSSSDAGLVSLYIPVLHPGDVQEVVELGRHAIALSRASGLWTAMKIVAAVADGSGTAELDRGAFHPHLPHAEFDGRPYAPAPSGRLLTPYTLDTERELVGVRTEIARRYGTDNGLNRVVTDPADAWIGIVASGHTWYEVLEALRQLGLDDEASITAAGIRMLQLRMPSPLDPQVIRSFGEGLAEIVVVEEKRPTVEVLIKEALYGRANAPVIVGKRDERGRELFAAYGTLEADGLRESLRARLGQRLSSDRLAPAPSTRRELIPLAINRTPYFCSGCPHNVSTKIPDGTLVSGGIGCHAMIALMPAEQVGEIVGLTAMGNEGANWIGMAPFVATGHIVQNLGDGTYAHSGHLAIRASIAAGSNITYKLLYNGAVSMTGGQHAEGVLKVPDLARVLLLEGAARVLVTTDDLRMYDSVELPAEVEVWDRTRLIEAQELLAAIPGTTVLIHDQACAAEKRRARKRGTLATPASRVLINERVCEGCGDCGATSNCLSVQPHDTLFGRKTQIHQSSCNFDMSCVEGDCPSFAMVTPARRRRRSPRRGARESASVDSGLPPVDDLPTPELVFERDGCTVRMSGIGGTGVVTVSQIVGTAALLDGLEARGLDQTGLSQKAGPVVSDLRIGIGVDQGSNKAPDGGVDVALAFDLLVAASSTHLSGARPGRTVVIGSSSPTPTGAMVVHPDLSGPSSEALRARLDQQSRPELNRYVDAMALAEGLFGEAAMANVLLLGVAVQAGALPIGAAAIEQAIELNGVAVDRNLAAFRWGRRWAVDPSSVDRAARRPPEAATETFDQLVARLADDLVGFQSAAVAERFTRLVERARDAERRAAGAQEESFARAVAVHFHKLLAYKDEYEVARLLLAPEARAAAERVGGPGARVTWKLHPPILRSLGVDHKISLGRWSRPVLVSLRAGKRLRGTRLDPFGYAEVRRLERAMIPEYESAVERLAEHLAPANHAQAVAIASLPDSVRGYEQLKQRRAAIYRAELAHRLGAFAPGRGDS